MCGSLEIVLQISLYIFCFIHLQEVSCSDFKLSLPLPLHEESDFVLPDYDITYGKTTFVI